MQYSAGNDDNDVRSAATKVTILPAEVAVCQGSNEVSGLINTATAGPSLLNIDNFVERLHDADRAFTTTPRHQPPPMRQTGICADIRIAIKSIKSDVMCSKYLVK